jgi:hypothetical protein
LNPPPPFARSAWASICCRIRFGGALGGALIRDKLFYFAAYQGQRQGKFLTVTPSVPLPQFFTSDLSAYTAPIRDPQRTGACTAADRTACFPGKLIPSNRISLIAQKFFSTASGAPCWPMGNCQASIARIRAARSRPC